MLVLLKFCWRAHIVSFSTKGARSFHIHLSLQNRVILVARGVLVLLKFCWRTHIISFSTKGARSFRMKFSLLNHVIPENVKISAKRAHPCGLHKKMKHFIFVKRQSSVILLSKVKDDFFDYL